MAFVIATPDDQSPHGINRAAVMLTGSVPCIGQYIMEEPAKCVQERGFIMSEKTYQENRDLFAGQESVLYVSECNKQYAWLVFSDGRDNVHLGCLKRVSEWEAKENDCWTYRPDLDQWFIAVENSQSRAQDEHDKLDLWNAIDRLLDQEVIRWTNLNLHNDFMALRRRLKPLWIEAERNGKDAA